MAETDITTKKSQIPLQINPSGVVKQTTEDEAEEKTVNIQFVNSVSAGNYPSSDYQTAKRTLEAFLEAGVETGSDLVVDGLHRGLGYQVTTISTKQPFKKIAGNYPTGESKISDEALVVYRHSEVLAGRVEDKLIGNGGTGNALVLAANGISNFVDKQVSIEAVIILPDKQPEIVRSNIDILLKK